MEDAKIKAEKTTRKKGGRPPKKIKRCHIYMIRLTGLIPSVYSTGETVQIRGLTYRTKSLVRSYQIESAWVSVRRNPTMQAYYRSHIGKQPNKIIIKVAHKLLRRMWHVIKTGNGYKTCLNDSTAEPG